MAENRTPQELEASQRRLDELLDRIRERNRREGRIAETDEEFEVMLIEMERKLGCNYPCPPDMSS